jgi:RNA polymerase sigma-70 factor (ECF subfamily)
MFRKPAKGGAHVPLPDAQRTWSAWHAFEPRLFRFLLSKLASRDDASDLMQEAYLRLIRIERPELIRNPETYLFRIASNLVGEFYLKRRNAPPELEIEAVTSTGQDSDDGAAASHIESGLELSRLQAIFASLPPLYRDVLILRKRDGLSHEEIAQRLNISPHTVHKYLTRALAKCRAQWEEQTP